MSLGLWLLLGVSALGYNLRPSIGGRGRLFFLSRELFQQLPEAPRGLIAIEMARRDFDDEAFPLLDGKLFAREQVIEIEKDKAGGEGGPLITIDKGMASSWMALTADAVRWRSAALTKDA